MMNCKNCGLPVFQGSAGYVGPVCQCQWRGQIVHQHENFKHQTYEQLRARVAELEADNAALTKALQHDRVSLQAEAKHPSPCQRFCEATAFRIDERRYKATIAAQAEQIKSLEAALKESKANDRCGMAYLGEVRAIVGGDDFPDMVKRVASQAEQIKVARDALKEAAKSCSQAHCALIVDEALAKLGEPDVPNSF